jgi:sigma-B regulation protein RsbU (phosphoserine phosphatase)
VLLLQLFMGVISITAIASLALVSENERSAQELKEQVLLKNQAYIQVDRINKDLENISESR